MDFLVRLFGIPKRTDYRRQYRRKMFTKVTIGIAIVVTPGLTTLVVLMFVGIHYSQAVSQLLVPSASR